MLRITTWMGQPAVRKRANPGDGGDLDGQATCAYLTVCDEASCVSARTNFVRKRVSPNGEAPLEHEGADVHTLVLHCPFGVYG